VLNRTIARTASFCSERNGHDDGSQWHQGLSFFLPNMTWLGPAGQYHAMLKDTWAPGALAVSDTQGSSVSVSAQKDEAGARVVVRLANKNATPATVPLKITGFASKPDVKVTTLSGTSLDQTNTPSNPLAIVPVVTHMSLPSGGGTVTVPAYSAVALELQAA
jgi:alpha-L-arabinofuranosidase